MEAKYWHELLRDLVEVWGVSSDEGPIKAYIQDRLHGKGEFWEDAVGNLHLRLQDEAPLLLTAHMDELGFIVTRVTEKGTAYVHPIGGYDLHILPGQPVEFRVGDQFLPGVFGFTPPHFRVTREDQKLRWEDLLVFFGFRNANEAESAGIRPGVLGRLRKQPLILANDRFCARGLDNRVGCAVLVALAEQLDSAPVEFVWTIQEEFGLRGARPALAPHHQTVLVVDTGSTTAELPHDPGKTFSEIRLGGGPILRALDRRHLVPRPWVDGVIRVAEKEGIPLQWGISGGGTDAAAFFEQGGRAIPLCVPLAFTHSNVEVVDPQDMTLLLRLLQALIREPPF